MMNIFGVLSLIWMGFIFFLSSLTRNDLKDLPNISDILGHGGLYFILGGLLYFSFPRYRGPLAIIIAALYGLSDEFHQSLVPGRTPEIKDLIVDTTAAATAVGFINLFKYAKKNRR